jgi:hypothetical protein
MYHQPVHSHGTVPNGIYRNESPPTATHAPDKLLQKKPAGGHEVSAIVLGLVVINERASTVREVKI